VKAMMKKKSISVLMAAVFLASLGASRAARAIEYQELEVYSHQMDGEGSKEIENLTSFSDPGQGADGVMRSSLEFAYGVTNSFQMAAYTDFNYTAASNLSLAGVRVRGRYSFFEQNQLPVDLGVYSELNFPRGEDNKVEGELRLIVSKDIERFTLSFNPMIERPLVVANGASTDIAWGAGASMAYRWDQHWLTHMDAFGQLGGDEAESEGDQLLLVPAVDYKVARNFLVGARAGFGVTDATEKRLAALRLEYEF
jgi:hypothetical protein